ncbi:histone-like nucleoid-structuring protein Lsr2 [Streptomyces sp. NPDC085866]|uniref:Lsr2 family DNA-binding protein n=1 Tax=Streptomyces sp. NPDC085866 TaxID=3365736 RepID=UPI0037D3B695
MTSSIDDLVRLCPPPTAPPSVDWAAAEARLGMPLPADYKRLASVYGPGRFADFIHIYHPLGYTQYVDLTGPMPACIREQLQKDCEQGTHPVPYDPQRLSPMGVTDNGEYLFWASAPPDSPDAWQIAVNEARGPRWFTFAGTLTAFLVAVLSGETAVPMFPKDLLQGGIGFTASVPSEGVAPMPRVRPPANPDDIRAWARANGYDVPLRGRIPAVVRDAWERATGSET